MTSTSTTLEPVSTVAIEGHRGSTTPSKFVREVRALLISVIVVVGVLPVIAVSWWVMWQAQVRLTPDPQAELIARLSEMGIEAGPPLDPEYYAYGKQVYVTTCVSCHGADGRGIAGNGKDLVHSEFVMKSDDDALVEFLKKGRDLSDPLNTTKILMPPKGGNPALTEDDMYDVVEYLRGLQDPRRIPSEAELNADADQTGTAHASNSPGS